MSSENTINKNIKITGSDLKSVEKLIKLHTDSLACPMESWLEDNLFKSEIYKLIYTGNCIGYAGLTKETLHFFYVKKEYFRYAPAVFEKIINEKKIKSVFVMSQDYLLNALIAEWDYEKEKVGCIFTDSGTAENTEKEDSTNYKVKQTVFRTASEKDIPKIRQVSGDFFEEASGGFNFFEERIEAGTIFVLENNEDLLGCGIIEKSLFNNGCVSIGMFVNRDFRKKGVARSILLHLKKWAYNNNLVPVAGCWYYNTLSRKSLESAGMIATSIVYEATLKGKEKLPLRTGNPPGELVEDI